MMSAFSEGAPMTAPQRRRTSVERKRHLLGQARRLFAVQGYPATTLEQVAEAAEVTPAVLAKHFADKKALLLGILDELRQTALERWPAEEAAADPLARLHTLTDRTLDLMRTHAEHFRVVHRLLIEVDEEAATVLRSFMQECEAFLSRIIVEGQQSGVFRRSLDPRVGAWELIRSALGFSLTLPLGVPLYGEPDYLARALDCLLHCLLKTDV
jgi:AcrR family transcriptional regulator